MKLEGGGGGGVSPPAAGRPGSGARTPGVSDPTRVTAEPVQSYIQSSTRWTAACSTCDAKEESWPSTPSSSTQISLRKHKTRVAMNRTTKRTQSATKADDNLGKQTKSTSAHTAYMFHRSSQRLNIVEKHCEKTFPASSGVHAQMEEGLPARFCLLC